MRLGSEARTLPASAGRGMTQAEEQQALARQSLLAGLLGRAPRPPIRRRIKMDILRRVAEAEQSIRLIAAQSEVSLSAASGLTITEWPLAAGTARFRNSRASGDSSAHDRDRIAIAFLRIGVPRAPAVNSDPWGAAPSTVANGQRLPFWDRCWHDHLLSEIDRIIAAGFDGVCLGHAGDYRTWEDERYLPETDMLKLVSVLARRVRIRNPGLLVILEGAPRLMEHRGLRNFIDAVAQIAGNSVDEEDELGLSQARGRRIPVIRIGSD